MPPTWTAYSPVRVESTGEQVTFAADRKWMPGLAAAAVFLWARKRPAGALTAALAAYGAYTLAQTMMPVEN